jgi:hypothetical protein
LLDEVGLPQPASFRRRQGRLCRPAGDLPPHGHRFLRRALCLSPLRASMPATPRERFIGTGFRCLAHAFTSSASQTGVARSRAIGSGKSGRRVHRPACVRDVPSISATSASPTRSGPFRLGICRYIHEMPWSVGIPARRAELRSQACCVEGEGRLSPSTRTLVPETREIYI